MYIEGPKHKLAKPLPAVVRALHLLQDAGVPENHQDPRWKFWWSLQTSLTSEYAEHTWALWAGGEPAPAPQQAFIGFYNAVLLQYEDEERAAAAGDSLLARIQEATEYWDQGNYFDPADVLRLPIPPRKYQFGRFWWEIDAIVLLYL